MHAAPTGRRRRYNNGNSGYDNVLGHPCRNVTLFLLALMFLQDFYLMVIFVLVHSLIIFFYPVIQDLPWLCERFIPGGLVLQTGKINSSLRHAFFVLFRFFSPYHNAAQP
jgi:hypothetical protein